METLTFEQIADLGDCEKYCPCYEICHNGRHSGYESVCAIFAGDYPNAHECCDYLEECNRKAEAEQDAQLQREEERIARNKAIADKRRRYNLRHCYELNQIKIRQKAIKNHERVRRNRINLIEGISFANAMFSGTKLDKPRPKAEWETEFEQRIAKWETEIAEFKEAIKANEKQFKKSQRGK